MRIYAVKQGDHPTREQLSLAADVFQLLGDRTRLSILWTLASRREESVGELAAVAWVGIACGPEPARA